MQWRLAKPFKAKFNRRDSPGHGVDPARVVRSSGQVSTEDGADQGEGQDHEEADRRDGKLETEHRLKLSFTCTVVSNSPPLKPVWTLPFFS